MAGFGPQLPEYAEIFPGVRRLLAPNPSMMTGPGTNTYLLGDDAVAVIDPGPALAIHIDNILAKTPGPIRWILVTHTHPDHSPGVRLLARETGADVLGMPAPAGQHQDKTFRATQILADGDCLQTEEFMLRAVHTPGHASNHICYLHEGHQLLFTGDHIIDGSTVVIDPPDGNMQHYIDSLGRCNALDCDALAPGHGGVIEDPERAINWIVEHRLQREAKVRAAMQAHPGLNSHELVPHVYTDVDPSLYSWAERSLLAHMLKIQAEEEAS